MEPLPLRDVSNVDKSLERTNSQPTVSTSFFLYCFVADALLVKKIMKKDISKD